jgi:starch-binding outer membrane protein, SusD/RagB family
MKSNNMIKTIVSVCLALNLLTSCKDSWLEVRPSDLVTFEDFWQTRAQLQAAVIGCYMEATCNAKDGNPDYYKSVIGQMMLWGELRADNVVIGPSILGDESKVMQCNIIPSNRINSWSRLYTVINNCNTVIDNANSVLDRDKSLSISEVNAFKAEALAMRSLMYFYLVRTYKSVPLVLQSSKTSEQNYNVAKSNEDVILKQIITDLKQAYSWAMSSYDNILYDKGRFTKTSIQALLADVYLWDQKYPECVASCNKVLENKEIVMVLDKTFGMYWQNLIFQQGNSNESIFEFQFGNANEGVSNEVLYQTWGSGSKNAHLSVPLDKNNWDLSTIFDEDDFRAENSFLKTSVAAIAGTVIKFSQSESSSANWIVYRLPEIYLMKAEALTEINYDTNRDEALRLVNKVFLRAHPTFTTSDSLKIFDYDSKEKMEDLILIERQREFLFEGKRWFDLMRYSRRETNHMRVFNSFVFRNIDVTYKTLAAAKFISDWCKYLPVPFSEMESNPLMEQNPFYATMLEQ